MYDTKIAIKNVVEDLIIIFQNTMVKYYGR